MNQVIGDFSLDDVSYCQEDRAEIDVVTFIARTAGTNEHQLYAFKSDDQGPEIMTEMGQAFVNVREGRYECQYMRCYWCCCSGKRSRIRTTSSPACCST